MLQGKVAGLMITNSTGQPGSSAQMRIRGVGTITAGQSPLIVVDGIRVEPMILTMLKQ